MPCSKPYQVLGRAEIKVHVRVVAISPLLSSGASTIASPSRHNYCQLSISDSDLRKEVLCRKRGSGKNDTSWGREGDHGEQTQTGEWTPACYRLLNQIFKQKESFSSYHLRTMSPKLKQPPPSQHRGLWLLGRISGDTCKVLHTPKALPHRLFLGSGRGLESRAVGGDHGCAQICIN